MTILKILAGLLGLSVIVAVHEWGHMIAALRTGVDVEIFSLGWGPKLFQFRHKKVLYRISAFPLGGYCKLKGEKNLIQALDKDMDSIPKESGDLYAASPLARIMISFAGPLSNFILAALFFCLTAFIGYDYQYQEARIVLASHVQNSETPWPSDIAGLEDGDIIRSLNGRKISQYNDIKNEALLSGSRPMKLEIERNGMILEKELIPERDPDTGSGILGIFPWIDLRFILSSPLGSGELTAGSLITITSINGNPVHHYFDITAQGDIISGFRYYGSDKIEKEYHFTEEQTMDQFLSTLRFSYEMKEFRIINPFKAFYYGLNQTGEVLYSSIIGIKRMFSGINLSENISGPLRISLMAGEMATSAFSRDIRTGITATLQFIAFISAALGFMNLLPISLLDGGQILIYLWEMITRHGMRPKTLYRLQLVGFAFVIILLLFSFGNDIIFLIQHRGSL